MNLNPVDAMTCDSVSLGPHPKTIFVFAFLQTNTNVLAFFSENQIFFKIWSPNKFTWEGVPL